MSRETKTVTIWTCVRCVAVAEVPDGCSSARPVDWTLVQASPGKTYELCGYCTNDLLRFMDGKEIDERGQVSDEVADEIVADVADQARRGAVEKRANVADEDYRAKARGLPE